MGARSQCKHWLLKAVSSTELQIGATAKCNYWRLNVTGSLREERNRVLRSARASMNESSAAVTPQAVPAARTEPHQH